MSAAGQTLHVTVEDPDNEHGSPAFDGPVGEAAARLAPGLYLTSDGGFLAVRTDSTAVALDADGFQR